MTKIIVTKEIRELMSKMDCHKAYNCLGKGFDQMCKARDIGLDSHLECLEGFPQKCNYSVPFSDMHYCRCPLRIHIARYN